MPKVSPKKHAKELKATTADAAPVESDGGPFVDLCPHCGQELVVVEKCTFHGDIYDVCEACEEPA